MRQQYRIAGEVTIQLQELRGDAYVTLREAKEKLDYVTTASHSFVSWVGGGFANGAREAETGLPPRLDKILWKALVDITVADHLVNHKTNDVAYTLAIHNWSPWELKKVSIGLDDAERAPGDHGRPSIAAFIKKRHDVNLQPGGETKVQEYSTVRRGHDPHAAHIEAAEVVFNFPN